MHYRAFKFYLSAFLILIFVGIVERLSYHASFYFSDILSFLLFGAYPFVVLYHFGKMSEKINAVLEKLNQQIDEHPPLAKKRFQNFTIDLTKDKEMELLAKELELMKLGIRMDDTK